MLWERSNVKTILSSALSLVYLASSFFDPCFQIPFLASKKAGLRALLGLLLNKEFVKNQLVLI
jgi:hypothetical protein